MTRIWLPPYLDRRTHAPRAKQRGIISPALLGVIAARARNVVTPDQTYGYNGFGGVGGQETTTDGDLVLLFLLSSTSSTPSAPSGWTKIDYGTTPNSYAAALYWSNYAAANAAANPTNFPFSLGYYQTASFRSMSLLQSAASLTSTPSNGATSVTVSALPSSTGSGSRLVAFVGSRDPTALSSSDGMTSMVNQVQNFFAFATYEQSGVQSGSRTFTKAAGSFETFGILVEVG